MTDASTERVLWQRDLALRYGVDRITIHKWERAGKLPPPDVVIGRKRGRYESSLREFERATAAA
jgi:predicted site-specific integrase-resolvase